MWSVEIKQNNKIDLNDYITQIVSLLLWGPDIMNLVKYDN